MKEPRPQSTAEAKPEGQELFELLREGVQDNRYAEPGGECPGRVEVDRELS